ncbi:MAG: hypothetical protein ACR2QU_02130 [Gammaproteobacteria bacterium]
MGPPGQQRLTMGLDIPADVEDWKPMAALDLFRVRNSKLVEHWDFVGPVSSPENFVHINGDF